MTFLCVSKLLLFRELKMKNCALLLLAASAAAFAPAAPRGSPPRHARRRRARAAVAKRAGPVPRPPPARWAARAPASARSPLEELAEGFAQLFRPRAAAAFNESGLELPGVVARCAVKGQNASRARVDDDQARGRGFAASSSGAAGGYNHYRSTAMGATAGPRSRSSRATSSTRCSAKAGRSATAISAKRPRRELSVRRVRVGGLYQLGDTVVEITEPIAPCAFLCTLPYLAGGGAAGRARRRAPQLVRASSGGVHQRRESRARARLRASAMCHRVVPRGQQKNKSNARTHKTSREHHAKCRSRRQRHRPRRRRRRRPRSPAGRRRRPARATSRWARRDRSPVRRPAPQPAARATGARWRRRARPRRR